MSCLLGWSVAVRAESADDRWCKARLEERAFRRVVGELDGSTIGVRRLIEPAEPAEQFRSCRPIQVVPVEFGTQRVELFHRRHRAGHVLERDGPVQAHHRSRTEPYEGPLERKD